MAGIWSCYLHISIFKIKHNWIWMIPLCCTNECPSISFTSWINFKAWLTISSFYIIARSALCEIHVYMAHIWMLFLKEKFLQSLFIWRFWQKRLPCWPNRHFLVAYWKDGWDMMLCLSSLLLFLKFCTVPQYFFITDAVDEVTVCCLRMPVRYIPEETSGIFRPSFTSW